MTSILGAPIAARAEKASVKIKGIKCYGSMAVIVIIIQAAGRPYHTEFKIRHDRTTLI